MRRLRRLTLLVLAIACAGGVLAACGGADGGGQAGVAAAPRGDPLAYSHRRPLSVHVLATREHGSVEVQRLSYAGAGAERVPALLAIPRRGGHLGCLIYQGGIGQTKEASSPLWAGAAKIGLSTFTIDPPYTGARARAARPLTQVVRRAALIRSLLQGSARDLRRGLDYLEGRPECRHNIGYLGTSLGGAVGALLAGDDPRVRAAVLTSLGATSGGALLASNLLLPGIASQPAKLAAAVRVLSPLDPVRWVPRISPRAVMLIDGTEDPNVPPADALQLERAAREPKVVFNFRGGHDPFFGPQAPEVAARVTQFLLVYLVGRAR
jgi:dienelactone hydrolase